MADFTGYRVSLGQSDYPAKYDGFVLAMQGFATELELGRQGQAALAANFGRYLLASQGLTQNLQAGGFRITGLPAPVAGDEPATKTYADGLAFASALPAISLDTYGAGVTNDGGTAEWGMSSAESVAVLGNLFDFF